MDKDEIIIGGCRMSFSGEVKRELCKISETSRESRRLIFHGMLYGGHKNARSSHSAENKSVAELFKHLSDEFKGVNPNERIRLRLPTGGGDDRQLGLFLRGVFLACGTVSDPDRDYHLELRLGEAARLEQLYTLITENGIIIKKSKSRLYIKESELISDFLTYIGAGVNSMEIMNAKILKELRNNINRSVNCEAANIEKTTRASGRQIADIELIYKRKGKDFLPPELRGVAELRLKGFEHTLKEIGEECEPKLSRSGVFHRLQKIERIAEDIRKCETDKSQK